MVYLRKKKVKGVDYLYLVKSTWDKEKKTSRQETIKYLGESSSVTRDDIPEEYREDTKINSFLLQNTPKDRKKREQFIEQLRIKLFYELINKIYNLCIVLFFSYNNFFILKFFSFFK